MDMQPRKHTFYIAFVKIFTTRRICYSSVSKLIVLILFNPVFYSKVAANFNEQATGLDAWASRVKCPARFVSHLHDICIYI